MCTWKDQRKNFNTCNDLTLSQHLLCPLYVSEAQNKLLSWPCKRAVAENWIPFFLFFLMTVKLAKPFLTYKHLVSFIQAHSDILTILLHLTFSKQTSNLTNSFPTKPSFLGGECKSLLLENRGKVFQPTSLLIHSTPRCLLHCFSSCPPLCQQQPLCSFAVGGSARWPGWKFEQFVHAQH